MADSEVGGPSLMHIDTPAATDRVPMSTGSASGGYSERDEFPWKRSTGEFVSDGPLVAGFPSAAMTYSIGWYGHSPAPGTVEWDLKTKDASAGPKTPMSVAAGKITVKDGFRVGHETQPALFNIGFFGNSPEGGVYDWELRTNDVSYGAKTPLRIKASGTTEPGQTGLNFGSPTFPWYNSYFAVSPTITSDRNAKSNIRPIAGEILDAWADVEWAQYDLISDDSPHVGLVAQQVHEALAAHDIDAVAVGLVVHEVTDDGEIWMLRYAECSAIEAAYQRRMIAAQDARIAALEAAMLSTEGEE